jgi:anthranilate phosphoribosyltransferase
MGQRTIFNILGPMTNPASAPYQLVGVFAPELTETMANVLKTLGSKGAYVVYGAEGLDELSTAGVNQVSRLYEGNVTTYELDPSSLGLPRGHLADFVGGTPEENAQITRDILSGQDTGRRRDIVLLNAAATLSVENDDLQAGLTAARESIESGAALKTLDAWVAKTNSYV